MEDNLKIYNSIITGIREKHKFDELVQKIIKHATKTGFTFQNTYDGPLYLKYKAYINDLLSHFDKNERQDKRCLCCEENFPYDLYINVEFLYKTHKIESTLDYPMCFSCRDMYMTENFPPVFIESYKSKLVYRRGFYFGVWCDVSYEEYYQDNEEEYGIQIADYRFLEEWTEEKEKMWKLHYNNSPHSMFVIEDGKKVYICNCHRCSNKRISEIDSLMRTMHSEIKYCGIYNNKYSDYIEKGEYKECLCEQCCPTVKSIITRLSYNMTKEQILKGAPKEYHEWINVVVDEILDKCVITESETILNSFSKNISLVPKYHFLPSRNHLRKNIILNSDPNMFTQPYKS